jgi:hypothetical protein
VYTPPKDVYDKLPLMKCHSLAPPETFGDPSSDELSAHADRGGKCIFMFGDPVESVISTRLKRYDSYHAANCGYTGSLDDTDIYDTDAFGYERMFDTWMKDHDYPVLALRYETLGEHLDEVDRFLDRSVKWNTFRARKSSNREKVSDGDLKRIENTYRTLIDKVAGAPNISRF